MDGEARLPDVQLEFWNAYREQELQRVRAELHPSLDRFDASLLRLPPKHWEGRGHSMLHGAW